jgi:hypothetical protein
MATETREHSFDELAKGLASGTLSRGKAIRWMGGALLGAALASFPGVAWANDCRRLGRECRRDSQCCSRNCIRRGDDRVCGCPTGQARCNDRCVNLKRNERHCGRCGKRCAAGEECVGGQCQGGSCPSGTTPHAALSAARQERPACMGSLAASTRRSAAPALSPFAAPTPRIPAWTGSASATQAPRRAPAGAARRRPAAALPYQGRRLAASHQRYATPISTPPTPAPGAYEAPGAREWGMSWKGNSANFAMTEF